MDGWIDSSREIFVSHTPHPPLSTTWAPKKLAAELALVVQGCVGRDKSIDRCMDG